MTLINKDTCSSTALDITAHNLMKRISALIEHLGTLTGDKTAENHAREIASLFKSLKELCAFKEDVMAAETSQHPKYTPEEKLAMAKELANIVIKNGGHL